jgi:hypothetical protein
MRILHALLDFMSKRTRQENNGKSMNTTGCLHKDNELTSRKLSTEVVVQLCGKKMYEISTSCVDDLELLLARNHSIKNPSLSILKKNTEYVMIYFLVWFIKEKIDANIALSMMNEALITPYYPLPEISTEFLRNEHISHGLKIIEEIDNEFNYSEKGDSNEAYKRIAIYAIFRDLSGATSMSPHLLKIDLINFISRFYQERSIAISWELANYYNSIMSG